MIPEGRELGIPKHTWEDNIKMAVTQELDLSAAAWGTWASACEHSNKISGSRKG